MVHITYDTSSVVCMIQRRHHGRIPNDRNRMRTMNPTLPQLLRLAPRGVIVDETGAYQGLAPWFESRLLREILRRYNEHQPLADFVEAWARMPEGATATGADARREAALALDKARKLSTLADDSEPEPPLPRAVYTARRTSDRREVGRNAGPAGKEPSGVN
jgi:hypothetical protein